MGLLRAGAGALGSVLTDQWKDYYYCEALPADVLVARGQKRSDNDSNNRGNKNIISNGSAIAVADGQCMIIIEQGKVAEICAQPGEFTYDSSSEPSIFTGDFGDSLADSFQNIGKRFTYGAGAPNDQRIYYVNTKEVLGNKYGTPDPIPFRVVDTNIGLDVDITIRCYGAYSYRIKDPVLFYTNVCGNVEQSYTRDQIDSQLKSELLSALQPAFAKISALGIRYSALPGHTDDLRDALKEELTAVWGQARGIEIADIGVSSIKASERDEEMIKELQMAGALRDPNLAAAHLAGAQAEAMQNAAANQTAGPAMAFMGMNMAANVGGADIQSLYNMGRQNQQPQQEGQTKGGWTCVCGHSGNIGKFCTECGTQKPTKTGWTCPSCSTVNKGKFCLECGEKKPANEPLYQCDKCGWEPKDPKNPPKFCPECGDIFDENDRK